jgi:hypothetical protein
LTTIWANTDATLAGLAGLSDGRRLRRGYGALAQEPDIEHLVCLAHARRKLVDAVKVQPKGRRSLADQAVEMIGNVYRIERDIR